MLSSCIYSRREGQAELVWVVGYILKWFSARGLSPVSLLNRLLEIRWLRWSDQCITTKPNCHLLVQTHFMLTWTLHSMCLLYHLLCPAQGALSDYAVWCLFVWRLSVCRVHPGGMCGWPARWRVLAYQARPAWLKAAAARFHCMPGRGILWRPPAYSLFITELPALSL